ncbi:MAG: orotate phosphoribosyltransferase [Candidatus Micrarchaeota archaeon]|nr:orotate phosphoribosyltransferase [Candidatus Micrarchaeota archaeon]
MAELQKYQADFIELAIFAGALKFGRFTLKSGRVSPYFFSSGVFYTGEYSRALSTLLAELICRKLKPEEYDVVFGPAYKGIPLAVSTSMALVAKGINKPWCFNRKEEKAHGDKGVFVGAPIEDGARIAMVDDVFTTGGAKEEAIAQLQSVARVSIPGVFILLDRREVDASGKNAIAEFEEKHDTKVYSIVNADQLFDYLEHNKSKLKVSEDVFARYTEYKKQYGV